VLGDTEIRASALDLCTGRHVKTNIDFLAYWLHDRRNSFNFGSMLNCLKGE
jgi:hypothetical protein